LNDFLNQESEKLLKDGHQEIKKGNMMFQWMNLTSPMAEDLLLCGQTPEENGVQTSGLKEGLKQEETPSTLLEGDLQADPLAEDLGVWGMATEFPFKMSG
jgi:hypothetical protein